MYRLLVITFLFLLTSTVTAQVRDEQILNFDSFIMINKDASLDITETIRVYSNQRKIRHGLVRWLPTNYFDSYGVKHQNTYKIRMIKNNNQTTAYHTSSQNNQFIIYIGDRNKTLTPGEYTYTIQYHVNEGVNFLKDQDELYWNITGNGWDFPILETTATIQLPADARITTYNAFTGKIGAQEKLYKVIRPASNQIQFITTQPIKRGQGLTIAVGWPKSIMNKPSFAQKIHNHPDQTFSIQMTVILILYYLLIWMLYGTRPKRGTIIPLFTPPLNLSPSVMRYVYMMKYDIKCFTTALVNMATNGFLTLSDIKNEVVLTKKNNSAPLAEEETVIAEKLFPKKTGASLELSNSNNEIIASAAKSLKKFLHQKYQDVYFMNNFLYLIPGWIFGGISFLVIFYSARNNDETFVALACILFWSIPAALIISKTISKLKLAYIYPRISNLFFGTILLIISIGLICLGAIIFSYFSHALPILTLSLFIVTLLINIGFIYLMRIPTPSGRQLMDQINGFKMFLSATEKDRLAQLHPPTKTPELFQKLLPYAIALDVENEWGNQFNEVLSKAATPETNFQPSWYNGTNWSTNNPAGFATGLNSAVTASLLSSMVTSGSASGGSSSGSSGGGGGGGGGGGW